MANIIEDWNVVQQIAERSGYYQLLAVDGSIEIRVLFRNLVYRKEFKDGNDKLLNQILDFCPKYQLIQIGACVRDEEFFGKGARA